MKTFQLSAKPRTEIGKKAAKGLRKEGFIPVVMNGGEVVELPYNGKLEAGQEVIETVNNKGILVTNLKVTVDDVRKLIYTPDVFAIELDIEGTKKMAVLKEVQFHPVKEEILHIDLLEVSEDKPVTIEVPVKIEGHAVGVKAGGKLNLSMKKIKVKAVYTNIPERVVVNVDALELGKTIQVGDLHFEGLELVTSPSVVVCQVKMTRSAMSAAAKAQ